MAFSSRSLVLLTFKRGAVRTYHYETLTSPELPHVSLHEPNFYFLISEDGLPLKYLVPEIPKVEITNNLMKIRERMLQRTSKFDILLFSNEVQSARAMGLKNYIIATAQSYRVSQGGLLNAELISLTEKVENIREKTKANVSEIGAKMTEMSKKLPVAPLLEKWNMIKEKLPEWQNAIANKLQSVQDSINKKLK